jgi:hypothetical protein
MAELAATRAEVEAAAAVVVLDSKGEVADAIRHAQAAAEAECGRKLHVLRTDNGGEFTAAEFASYCADEGVQRHYSAPYSPPQAEGNAGCLLGRGGGDGCLHPQPLTHQGSQRQDAVRGLAWAQADGISPTGLRLPHVRHGAWPHRQARRQEHPGGVHRLRGGLEGLPYS